MEQVGPQSVGIPSKDRASLYSPEASAGTPSLQATASTPAMGQAAMPPQTMAPVVQPASHAVNVNVSVGGPTIVVAHASTGPSFLVRAIWFLVIGWWLAGVAISVGYFAAFTIIGLPLAFYIFNRIPACMTLRARRQEFTATVQNGVTMLKQQTIAQHPLWARALYFVFVGWWLGAFWLLLAYALCIAILTMPLGIMMFDRTGGVMTLLRH